VSVHYTLFLPTPIKTVVSAPSTVNLALTTPWRFTPWDLRGRVWRAGGLPNSGGKPSFQRLEVAYTRSSTNSGISHRSTMISSI